MDGPNGLCPRGALVLENAVNVRRWTHGVFLTLLAFVLSEEEIEDRMKLMKGTKNNGALESLRGGEIKGGEQGLNSL